MSQSAYQPGYTIAPKYGQRYMNSSFAPSVGAPQSAAVSQPAAPPQPAGQGYSMANPFAGNAQFTQAQQNYSTNVGAQPTTGFRRAIPGVQGAGPSTPPVGTIPGMPTPPVTNAGGTTAASSGGGDDSSSTDYIPSAEKLGYTRGTSNPIAGALALVPGGMMLSNALDLNKDYTYGNYGTYDAQGNVFGPDGRAYNPETGRAAQSYASPSNYLGSYLGIGTPEGVLGSSSSYGKLRAAGEDVPNSLLGSYDDSVYKQMDYNPNLNIAGARAARYSNPAAPMGTIADQMAIRAQIARGDYTGLSDDDIDRMGDPNAPKFGYGTGDYAATNFGLGQRNESGTISLTDSYGNPSGTVVAISDSTNPGQNISLLSKNAQTQLKANQELDNRASRGEGGMAGFNVSDGDGGSYQTDSSGTGNWNTGGPTGMEDEYDDGPAMPTKAEIEASNDTSGGK